MAKQDGLYPILGTIGNLTFYKSKGKYFVRGKSGVPGNRIKKDPRFARTRQNMAAFGRAGKAGKLVRTAFAGYIEHIADTNLTGRLVRELLKVIRTDEVSSNGECKVINGKIALLEGFSFNDNCRLEKILPVPYTAVINRASGKLSIGIPAFKPFRLLGWPLPMAATHFKIITVAAAIDFEQGGIQVKERISDIFSVGERKVPELKLAISLPVNNKEVWMLSMGIEFYREEGKRMVVVRDKTINTLGIVKVSGGEGL